MMLFCSLGHRSAAEPAASQVEWSELPIGGRAAGRVHDVKDYGVVCDLDAHADVVALATPDQVPPWGILSADHTSS